MIVIIIIIFKTWRFRNDRCYYHYQISCIVVGHSPALTSLPRLKQFDSSSRDTDFPSSLACRVVDSCHDLDGDYSALIQSDRTNIVERSSEPRTNSKLRPPPVSLYTTRSSAASLQPENRTNLPPC